MKKRASYFKSFSSSNSETKRRFMGDKFELKKETMLEEDAKKKDPKNERTNGSFLTFSSEERGFNVQDALTALFKDTLTGSHSCR